MTEPEQLLALARDVLSRPAGTGAWPRAVALLARQALEQFPGDLWAWKAPDVALVSTRAQLICLPAYLDDEIAARANHLWWALSRACHHHPYELPPTAAELTALLDELARVFDDTESLARA